MDLLLQDGEPMKVPGGVNPSFTEVNATTELLLKVNLLKCHKDDDQCMAPGAAITDFNIWDKSTSVEGMVAWTKCRSYQMMNHVLALSQNVIILGANPMAT